MMVPGILSWELTLALKGGGQFCSRRKKTSTSTCVTMEAGSGSTTKRDETQGIMSAMDWWRDLIYFATMFMGSDSLRRPTLIHWFINYSGLPIISREHQSRAGSCGYDCSISMWNSSLGDWMKIMMASHGSCEGKWSMSQKRRMI